jgi:hypothetical protein
MAWLMAGTAPGEQGLIHLIPPAPSLWFGLVLTVNAPRSLFVVHGYPPGKRMTLCSKDTRRFLARSAHDGSVDATTTSGDEPHDSGKIYHLRLYHYVGIFVWTMRRDQRSGPPPTHQRNRINAEGKSRREGLPTRRGSLSKVSMPGKPCW